MTNNVLELLSGLHGKYGICDLQTTIFFIALFLLCAAASMLLQHWKCLHSQPIRSYPIPVQFSLSVYLLWFIVANRFISVLLSICDSIVDTPAVLLIIAVFVTFMCISCFLVY